MRGQLHGGALSQEPHLRAGSTAAASGRYPRARRYARDQRVPGDRLRCALGRFAEGHPRRPRGGRVQGRGGKRGDAQAHAHRGLHQGRGDRAPQQGRKLGGRVPRALHGASPHGADALRCHPGAPVRLLAHHALRDEHHGRCDQAARPHGGGGGVLHAPSDVAPRHRQAHHEQGEQVRRFHGSHQRGDQGQ